MIFVLTDTDLVLLVERQPGIETVSLAERRGYYLSQNGLAQLGRLPSLRSLTLSGVPGSGATRGVEGVS